MTFLYVLAAIAVAYIAYSLFIKKPADPSLLRKRCGACDTLIADLSLLKCPVCEYGKLGQAEPMTEREANGFFLDKYLHPVNPNDEEDNSIYIYFENYRDVKFGDCPNDKNMPSEVRQLRTESRQSLIEYIKSIETFSIKPTWFEVMLELERRHLDHNNRELELCKKLGVDWYSFDNEVYSDKTLESDGWIGGVRKRTTS